MDKLTADQTVRLRKARDAANTAQARWQAELGESMAALDRNPDDTVICLKCGVPRAFVPDKPIPPCVCEPSSEPRNRHEKRAAAKAKE